MGLRHALDLALFLVVISQASCAPSTRVLGPSGAEYIAPSANDLVEVNAPDLAPAEGASPDQVQADCLTEEGVFYGSDFLSTTAAQAASASDCCSICKLARECTVWNWCGAPEGCPLPPNLQQASNVTNWKQGTCLYKPRPISFGGTLPLTPASNSSSAMTGWTSGIPINGTLLPTLPGFELTTGVDLDYNEDVDFYCTGSSTSKPVCQMYGNSKGAAAACIANPVCRGFQICWSFPVSADYFRQTAVIRLKAGPVAPLNISSALQNPYCSVYVLKAGAASSPNAGTGGYSLRDATNASAIGSAAQQLAGGSGRRLLANETAAAAPSAEVNLNQVRTPAGAVNSTAISTNLTGQTLQGFQNVTFNYTQCYSNAPSIRAVVQSQTFPLQGPSLVNSIHTWTEVPFHNNGDYCCAFQDIDDFFLNLDTGVIATSKPIYVATNVNLTNGVPLKNYDTVPATTVQPLVYLPANQLSTGQGRQYTFPQINSTAYVDALEKIYYSVAQVALGNIFCTTGSPQLASAVNFLTDLLADVSEDGITSPGGIPVDMQLQTPSESNPDGSYNNSCLVESDTIYQGDLLESLNSTTAEECCSACWSYGGLESQITCDVWVLSGLGACDLKNSTLAAAFKPIPATRNSTAAGFLSGRRTAVLSQNSTSVFGTASA